MDLIETLNPSAFTDYLKKLGNTICGRHPIGVLLQVFIFISLCRSYYLYSEINVINSIGGHVNIERRFNKDSSYYFFKIN